MSNEEKHQFEKFSEAVEKKYQEAIKKHPHYPSDIFHQLSILTEEAGEVAKAVNDYYEKDNQNTNNLKEELLQTAAMCFRMYNNIKEF